jgi:hypothetical protein
MFFRITFNFALIDFYSVETLITFYIPLLLSNDELLRCCIKSDVRNGKDVVSFTLSFMILI